MTDEKISTSQDRSLIERSDIRRTASGELSTFSNITHIENARLWDITPAQSILQHLRWLQYIFFGQHPCPPMYTHRFSALGILEDLNGVKRIGVH